MRSGRAAARLPPWARATIAGLLSLVLPGSGSFYLGRRSTAIAALTLATLGSLSAALAWRLDLLSGLSLVISVALTNALAHGGGAVLATREAWRSQVKRSFIASAGFMLVAAAALLAMQQLSRTQIMAVYGVATIAMEPNLRYGDRVLVRPRSLDAPYRRGELVALVNPERNEAFVRRIVGLPGDHVQIDGADVLVDGQRLRAATCDSAEPGCFVEVSSDGLAYRAVDRLQGGAVDLEVRVPTDRVFVMRDRRDLTVPLDPVPRSWLRGAVMDVWWSFDTPGVDLARVGTRVAPTAHDPTARRSVEQQP